MAERFKIGYHILPTDEQVFDCLRQKVLMEDRLISPAALFHFPVTDRDLYSGVPWEVLKDDDPWEIENSGDESVVKRFVFVFTKLKLSGKKRFVRTAGGGTWDGSTGEVKIRKEGLVIGGRRYLDFKLKENPQSRDNISTSGHWMMHEYKLTGESLKGLEDIPLAKTQVLCQITHVSDKNLGIHLNWPKPPLLICFEEFERRGLLERICDDPSNKRKYPDQETINNSMKKRKQNQKEAEISICSSAPTITNLLDDFLTTSDAEDNQLVVYAEALDEATIPSDNNMLYPEATDSGFADQLERDLLMATNNEHNQLVEFEQTTYSTWDDQAQTYSYFSAATTGVVNEEVDPVVGLSPSLSSMKQLDSNKEVTDMDSRKQVAVYSAEVVEEITNFMADLPDDCYDECLDVPPLCQMDIPALWEDKDFQLAEYKFGSKEQQPRISKFPHSSCLV